MTWLSLPPSFQILFHSIHSSVHDKQHPGFQLQPKMLSDHTDAPKCLLLLQMYYYIWIPSDEWNATSTLHKEGQDLLCDIKAFSGRDLNMDVQSMGPQQLIFIKKDWLH